MKRDVTGLFVKRLSHIRLERGMRLIPEASRCLLRGEIHEIVTTDHIRLQPGDPVNRVGFLGFTEVEQGGVVEIADEVFVEDRRIGAVVGFDACHVPNHYNIIIKVRALITGNDLGLAVGTAIRFHGEQEDSS